MKKEDIDEIVLVGGSTRIPKVGWCGWWVGGADGLLMGWCCAGLFGGDTAAAPLDVLRFTSSRLAAPWQHPDGVDRGRQTDTSTDAHASTRPSFHSLHRCCRTPTCTAPTPARTAGPAADQGVLQRQGAQQGRQPRRGGGLRSGGTGGRYGVGRGLYCRACIAAGCSHNRTKACTPIGPHLLSVPHLLVLACTAPACSPASPPHLHLPLLLVLYAGRHPVRRGRRRSQGCAAAGCVPAVHGH
jgi:hypothetical protein